MLHTLKVRLSEFSGKKDLSEFEQGRQLAYTEMMDIIKNRHSMLLEVLDEE